jgi:hypothetical protein
MRNAMTALVLLVVAGLFFLLFEPEPDLSVGEAEPTASSLTSSEGAPAPGEESAAPDPYESVDDPRYRAARAERDERLRQIREEAEQRAQREGTTGGVEAPGRSELIATGGGRAGGGESSSDATVVTTEAAPDETEDPTPGLIALETEAARLAQELDLVPESRLEGLSEAEQRSLLADEYVWHTFLVEKFGPNYTISQQNQAAVARDPFDNATADERLRRLRDAI